MRRRKGLSAVGACTKRQAYRERQEPRRVMNLKKKLANPFVLVAQGFVAGAILFFAVSQPIRTDSGSGLQAQAASAAKTASV